MGASRKNEATYDSYNKRWRIVVQRDGEVKTYVKTGPQRGAEARKIKAELERKADKWLEHSAGPDEDIKVLTTCEMYLERVKLTCSPEHFRQQNRYVMSYIVPKIGNKKWSKITPAVLQNIIDEAYRKGKNGAPLSHKSLENLRGAISGVCKMARQQMLTGINPDLIIPRSALRIEKKILQPEALRALLSDENDSGILVPAYKIMVLTGLRPGELRGLMWSDIDMDVGTAHVRRSIDCKGNMTQGKNKNANRTLALSKMAVEVLQNQKEILEKSGLGLVKWVFPLEQTEEPPSLVTLRKWWIVWQERHGFSPISLYELRHTFVSVCDNMPEGLKRQMMGHSRSMDTEGVYGHKKRDDLARMRDCIDSAFSELEEKS